MIGLAFVGVGLGAGLVVIGVGIGIGRIGGSATEGISRQPEASGSIQTAMIIAAALVEGVALFGLVIVFLMNGLINKETLSEFASAHAAHHGAPADAGNR